MLEKAYSCFEALLKASKVVRAASLTETNQIHVRTLLLFLRHPRMAHFTAITAFQ